MPWHRMESADFLDRANFFGKLCLAAPCAHLCGYPGRWGSVVMLDCIGGIGMLTELLQHVETHCNGINWNQQGKHWCHVQRPNLKKG